MKEHIKELIDFSEWENHQVVLYLVFPGLQLDSPDLGGLHKAGPEISETKTLSDWLLAVRKSKSGGVFRMVF